MPRRRNSILTNLRIDEVALCREGMNPHAEIMLYKARDAAANVEPAALIERLAKAQVDAGTLPISLEQLDAALPDPVRKDEHDDPPTFEDSLMGRRLMEIDSAIDVRLFALLDTTTRIMRAQDIAADARAELILDAVAGYASAMERDVPRLFSGELSKALTKLFDGRSAAGEGPPTDAAVADLITKALDAVDLLPATPALEDNMDFLEMLKALTDDERTALSFIIGGADPKEYFKGKEPEGVLVVATAKALVASNTELAKAQAECETAVDALAKARGEETDPLAMLKAMPDSAAKTLAETTLVAMGKQGDRIVGLEKAAVTKELEAVVKALEHLPNENGALLIVLEKSHTAGIRKEIEAVLVSANEQAKLGKLYSELGMSTEVGDAHDPTQADAQLVAKATEIRKVKPDLSAEQAYGVACEENPELYVQATARDAN